MKMKSQEETMRQTLQENELLGKYNMFSRTRVSQDIPLRTVFLDPKVNNFAKSKTRTELMKKINSIHIPHPSYDLVSLKY